MDKVLEKIGEYTILIIVYSLNELRKWHEKRQEKKLAVAVEQKKKIEEIQSVGFSVEVSLKIERILFDIQAKFRSHRCFITQFHNGEKYFSGVIRLKETVTNEVVFPGQKKIKPDVNAAQMTDSSVKIVDYLKNQEHSCYYVEDIEWLKDRTVVYFSPELHNLMTVYQVRSFICVCIRDKVSNEPVAMLTLHFPHNRGMDSRVEITELIQMKNRIEAIFDEIEN